MARHRQLQIVSTKEIKKFTQIGHLVFELRAFLYFFQADELEIELESQ
jgi:hypothetical protein